MEYLLSIYLPHKGGQQCPPPRFSSLHWDIYSCSFSMLIRSGKFQRILQTGSGFDNVRNPHVSHVYNQWKDTFKQLRNSWGLISGYHNNSYFHFHILLKCKLFLTMPWHLVYIIEVCGLELLLEENQSSKRNRLFFEFSTVKSLEISTIFFSKKVRD